MCTRLFFTISKAKKKRVSERARGGGEEGEKADPNEYYWLISNQRREQRVAGERVSPYIMATNEKAGQTHRLDDARVVTQHVRTDWFHLLLHGQ